MQDNNVGQALPGSPDTETEFWKLWLSGGGDDLEALTAEDTSNVTGGGAGQVVVAQTLIDAIANKVMNDLVAKSQIINNLLATQAGNVLDATQGKALKDEIDQLNSDFQNCYQFSGGTSIPENADMKSSQYLIPGNYYCGSNITAVTLSNCPFDSAFLLKVEWSLGGNAQYIRQTFKQYDNNKIISRVYFVNESKWQDETQYITNADIDGHLYLNSTGATAIESGSGSTRYRMQLNANGVVMLYKSTDGGSSWPESKTIASFT